MAGSVATASQLRRAFCDFFVERQHFLVKSASLVPSDPSLLFNVAGMVPFKQYFLGLEKPPYLRAVSVQKCLRAGGKHNDLEEIGHTNRHLSFFEMLGNFSFGDYFKTEAISWAWEFSTQVLDISSEDIWVTIHISDDEAESIWLEKTEIDPKRIQKLDEPNYWRMGDTGPCGPCTELYFDRGSDFGPEGGPAIGGEDRYMEFWNLVFMQYEQKPDGSQEKLPSPSIDTGAGLERILALINGADSIFNVGDLYELLKKARNLTKQPKTSTTPAKEKGADTAPEDVYLRILAEHSRAAAFILADGVIPSNEERGYVLRRIIRRAVRYAHLLDAYSHSQNIMVPMAKKAIQLAGSDYPELNEQKDRILEILEREEGRFLQTLETGGKLLKEKLAALKPAEKLDGSVVFALHDTYGFPYDLTAEIAGESNHELDIQGFESEMAKQKERARADFDSKSEIETAASTTGDSEIQELAELVPTEFLGNSEYEVKAKVLKVLESGIVLDRTSFYAEAGGQVGDTGRIILNGDSISVLDAVYKVPGIILHKTKSRPALKAGDEVTAAIDGTRRDNIRRHHTATHILHWALREVLGDHVSPQGSLVTNSRLRFDFSHWSALSSDEIAAVEDKCNSEILTNQPVRHFETTRDEANALGAVAFFEEKYGDIVKVLEAGENSIELCGGTHVSALGDIGLLKIISEGSVGANIRRVEAVCGSLPVELLRKLETETRNAADILGVAVGDLMTGARKKMEEIKNLQQELGQIKSRGAMGQLEDLAKQAHQGVLAAKVESVSIDTLRKMAVALKDKEEIQAAVLGAESESGGASLVAALDDSVLNRLTAGELLAEAAKLISGGGGKGRELAVAGGKDASGLDSALDLAAKTARQKLSDNK